MSFEKNGLIWMFPKIVGLKHPKSSILMGCSITNHLFWGTPIFGNTHICKNTQNISKHSRWCSPQTWSDHIWSTPNLTILKIWVQFDSTQLKCWGHEFWFPRATRCKSKGNLKKSHVASCWKKNIICHRNLFRNLSPCAILFSVGSLSCFLPTQRLWTSQRLWASEKIPPFGKPLQPRLDFGPGRWEEWTHEKFGWWFHPIKMETPFSCGGKYTPRPMAGVWDMLLYNEFCILIREWW